MNAAVANLAAIKTSFVTKESLILLINVVENWFIVGGTIEGIAVSGSVHHWKQQFKLAQTSVTGDKHACQLNANSSLLNVNRVGLNFECFLQ